MNLLFVTFYFPPEIGAPQRRIWETAQHLIKRGHRVQVLTGFPNYPRGEIIPPYDRRLFLREKMEGIEVLRVFHFLGSRKGKWGRAVAEGSFAVATAVAALVEAAPDAVIVESPSLLSCWTGVLLQRLRGAAFVMHVSDLIPELAEGVGMLEAGRLLSALERMASFFYRQADAVVAVTHGFRENVLAKGVAGSRVWLIPNGVEDACLERNVSRAPNGKFKIIYSGNLGRAYNLRSVLDAARFLPSEEFEFVFVGDGIDRIVIESGAQTLPQVRLLGGMKVNDMFDHLYSSGAMVIPLAGNPAFLPVIPSKLGDAMAAGIPVVLAAGGGEAAGIVEQNKAGLVVEPDSPQALAEAFRYLRDHPEEARRMGERGREFVRQTRRRSLLVDQLEKMLFEVVGKKRMGR